MEISLGEAGVEGDRLVQGRARLDLPQLNELLHALSPGPFAGVIQQAQVAFAEDQVGLSILGVPGQRPPGRADRQVEQGGRRVVP